MPAPVPETTKSKVIDMWPLCSSRDSIASANNISTGAVSNIVKEWKDRIGKDVMRGLREIGALLKREGLSPAQCAIGFRIMKMFADQGVDGEAAEHFVSGMYRECNRLGITPSNIVTYYKIAIDEAQKRYEKLESQNSSLLERISLHSSKADLYNELDVAGFGIAELRRLLDTITNIATSKQISHWVAIGKFFSDLETQYDAKLGFEVVKDKLITEIKMLDVEREKKLENLRNQPLVGPIIAGLLNLGLYENDILGFAKVYLNIQKRSSSMKGIALGMIEAVIEMATSRNRTTSDD